MGKRQKLKYLEKEEHVVNAWGNQQGYVLPFHSVSTS